MTDEADFLQVFANASFDHLFDNIGRLARFQGLFGKDLAFLFQNILRDFVGGGIRRVHGSNVHGDIGTEFGGSSFQFDQDTNTVHVNIGTNSLPFFSSTRGHTTDLNVFSNLGDQGLSVFFNVGRQLGDIVFVDTDGRSSDLVAEFQKASVLSNEIGFAIDFDEDGLAILLGDGNLSFGSHTRSLFVGLGQSVFAQKFGSGFHVSIDFEEGLFTVHHTGTSSIAEFLNHLGSDFGKECRGRRSRSHGLLDKGTGSTACQGESQERNLHGD